MRHADEDVADAGLARLGNHFVEDWHEHVEPLDREARLARERALQKALERLDFGQTVEQLRRIDRIGRGAETAALGRLAEPFALLRHEHMRVVVARRRAVNAAERLDGVVSGRDAVERTGDEIRWNRPEVFVGDAVGSGQE